MLMEFIKILSFYLVIVFIIVSCGGNSSSNTSYKEKVPNSGEEWFEKAMNEPDTQLQIIYYTKALEYQMSDFPNYCSALNNRGVAKMNLKDFRGAGRDFILVSLNCPGMIISEKYAGYCALQLKNYEYAIEHFNKVIDSNMEDFFKSGAYFNKGICLYNLGDIDSACRSWSQAGQAGDGQAYSYIEQYCQ